MVGRYYRAQILLEPAQHTALAELARFEGRSVSDKVRQILQDYLEEKAQEALWRRREQAMLKLAQIRSEIEHDYGVIHSDLITETRDELDQNIQRVW